jgi:hypothetical protein
VHFKRWKPAQETEKSPYEESHSWTQTSKEFFSYFNDDDWVKLYSSHKLFIGNELYVVIFIFPIKGYKHKLHLDSSYSLKVLLLKLYNLDEQDKEFWVYFYFLYCIHCMSKSILITKEWHRKLLGYIMKFLLRKAWKRFKNHSKKSILRFGWIKFISVEKEEHFDEYKYSSSSMKIQIYRFVGEF